MPSACRIRPAASIDAAGILGVQREIYGEGRWFIGDGPPTLEALTRRLRALNEAMSLYLVATAERAEVCAWLELNRLQPRRLRHVALLTLAVAPAHRRQGIATALLGRAYEWAARGRIEKIQLNVRAGNAAAIALYSRQGFTEEGRERRQIREAGRYEDNLLMAKFLDAGGA